MTEFEEYFMTMVRMAEFRIIDLIRLMIDDLDNDQDISDDEYNRRMEVISNFLDVFYDA